MYPFISHVTKLCLLALLACLLTWNTAQAQTYVNLRGNATGCTGINEAPLSTSTRAANGGAFTNSRGSWREGAALRSTYTYTFSPALDPGGFQALFFSNVVRGGIHGNFTVTYADGTSTSDMVPAVRLDPYGFGFAAGEDRLAATRSQIGGSGPVYNGVRDGVFSNFAQATGTMAFAAIDPTKSVRAITWTILRSNFNLLGAQSGVRVQCPVAAPEIEAVKTSALTNDTGIAGLSAGDTLTYTITATNTGNVTLSGVAVQSDTLTQADASATANSLSAITVSAAGWPGTVGQLAPGASVSFEATYLVDQDDIDAGGLSNTATVVGTSPAGADVTDVSDDGNDGDGNRVNDPTEDLIDLMALVEKPLRAILEDDLLETATKQSRLFNGITQGARGRLNAQSYDTCFERVNDPVVTLNLDEGVVQTSGTFGYERSDCLSDEYSRLIGEFQLSDDDDLGTQGLLSITYQHEKLQGPDKVTGWFVGGYASRLDASTNLGDGGIDGTGGYAGLYGANQLPSELILDYYLAGSFGRHRYDIDFNIGGFPELVNADGYYTYRAAFGGAALSGITHLGEMMITPRMGVNAFFASRNTSKVNLSVLDFTDTISLDFADQSTIRAYSEITLTMPLASSGTDGYPLEYIEFTPLVSCQAAGAGLSDQECGGSLNLRYANSDLPQDGTLIFDTGIESIGSVTRGSVGLSYERPILNGQGAFRFGLGTSETLEPNATLDLRMRF